MTAAYDNLSREDLIAEIERLKQVNNFDPHPLIGALRDSEVRFRQAMEDAPIGMALTALDGHYLLLNRAFCRFLGYTQDELYNLTWRQISHPDDLPVDQGNIKRLLAGEIDTYTREKRYLRKDGGAVWGQLTVSLLRDEAGEPLYFIAQVVDINDRKLAAEALSKSAAEIQDLYDLAPCGYHSVDANGIIVRMNQTELEWLGYRPDEVIGKMHMADLYTEIGKRAFPENFRRFKETGSIYNVEMEMVRKDGSILPVLINAVAMYGENGEYLMSRSTVYDISARKAAEKALRASEEKFRTLVSSLPQKIFVKDMNSVYVSCNAHYAQDLGIAANEIAGKTDFDFYPRDLAEKYREDDENVMASGQTQELEERYIRDGKEFSVNTIKAPVRNDQGQVVGVVGVFWDITERKRVENALRESEERFRTMADNVPIIIWMADACGHEDEEYEGCGFFNRAWNEFTGLSLEQTQGRKWLDLVHPEDRQRCLDTYATAFELGSSFTQAYRLKRHDGKYRWMQDSATPRYTAEGKFLGLIGTCIDITRQVKAKAEQAKQQNALERSNRFNIAGEMASGLTHELSQPVNATLNYLDSCLRRLDGGDYDPDRQRQCLSLALKQTQRAGSIINNFKALIRKNPSARALQDINLAVTEAVTLLDYEIRHRGINVILELEAVPPVIGNQVEIQQVLLNVLKNAVDAMGDTPRRDLRLVSRPVERQRIKLEIRDTGHGIPESQLDSIFNPFQTTKSDGLGLGLAICRTLIENHEGRIWAESVAEGGTCIHILLPSQPQA